MSTNIIKSVFIVIILAWVSALHAQPSADAGKTVFRNYCASCHATNMKTKSTGPALGGMEERWADYPLEDLYGWIRNSQGMIASGHPLANALWDEYKPVIMTPFPNLTDDDIASILLYINQQYTKVPDQPSAGGTNAGGVVSSGGADYTWLYLVLFGVLAVLALILMKIIGGLDNIIAAKEGLEYEEVPLFKKIFTKRVISFITFGLIVLGGYMTVTRAINLGRQQEYAPQQPIKFSHETHAGVNQIDCQFCHDGARRSRHSVIPAANTCMKCHEAIKVGSTYGTAELSKIYASIGYNPNSGKYIEGYNEMEEKDIKAIFTEWIAQNYLETSGLNALDRKGEKLVRNQWDGIVSSLKNDQKDKIQGPIEWIRIHALPDHVYFNHAQHVSVGKIACQDCHGKVEQMAVVKQHAPLSMGWCVSCHRKTEVKFEGNEYYASFKAYHDQLSEGKKSKVTVEDIGGLECQKCHY